MEHLTEVIRRPDQATQAERDWAKAKFQEWADAPFTKVTVCPPSDDIPLVGRVANGGSTTSIPLTTPGNVATFNRLMGLGYRITRMWRVG